MYPAIRAADVSGSYQTRDVARSCALCGATSKLTKEHVFGRWTEDVLRTGRSHRKALWRVDPATGLRSLEEDAIPRSIHEVEVRALCGRCNSEWGSRLESEMKPVFTPLVHRIPTEVPAESAKIIAAWATKVTVLRELTNPREVHYIDRSISRHLHRHRVPPDTGVAIWAATSDELPGAPWWARARLGYLLHRELHAADPGPHAFVSFLTFAHLALIVVGTRSNHELRPIASELPMSFARIWPDPDGFNWPLPVSLTGREFDILYESAARFIGKGPGSSAR